MNICLIGNGLTSLVLAKVLITKNLSVSLFFESKKSDNLKSRTIGISKKNYDYFVNNIINIKKISWPIKNIEIYKESNLGKKIFNFKSNSKQLFSIVKYNNLYNLINNDLKKNKLFRKIKKNKIYYNDLVKNYKFDLIVNTDSKNSISKEFFFRKILKDYKSTAFTTILNHKKIKNDIATQIFTDSGPLAFLPISNIETSIVFSVLKNKNNYSEKKIKDLMLKYNIKFKIKSFSNFEKFNLKYLILKKYFHKNILSFGDAIHKVHPLAGQGFNMTIRDIKIFSDLIQDRLDLGLPLDSYILEKFESITKHNNFFFSSGINFINDFFKFENKYGNKYTNQFLTSLGKNKYFNKYASELADKGLGF